jgi:hypothetical protein
MKIAYEPRDSPNSDYIDFLMSMRLIRDYRSFVTYNQKTIMRFYLRRMKELRQQSGWINLPA